MMRSHADGDSVVDVLQHSSHRDLVAHGVSAPRGEDVDAVVVPAAREASHLHAASALAADLGCPLLILASRRASAREAESVAAEHDVKPLAVDVTGPAAMTRLETHESPYARDSDTSLKRNLALAVARMTGWNCVLFLDDDVTGVDPGEVRTAAALIGRYRAVGLENVGWYDNSVVCHANRDTGGVQDCFVGAGGLLVHASRTRSFFPNIYNEDWFFLLDEDQLTDVAISGTCAQARYDPYADATRARLEEFGDCLAEGLFALLDEGATLHRADQDHWRRFLAQRDALIRRISDRAQLLPDPARSRIRRSLAASHDSLAGISPGQCVAFLAAWRRDRATWQAWMDGLPRGLSADDALRHLRLIR